jgi:hypothetical protein
MELQPAIITDNTNNSTMYYHPKTGIETPPSIEYAKILTTTAQEVRRDVTNDSDALVMPATVKTLYDLLFQVILNEGIPVKQILSMRSDTSIRSLTPQVFEGMWTIALALGVVPGYESITMMSGKVETGLEKVVRSNTLMFLKDQPLATSSKSGASDISFSMEEVTEMSMECSPPPETTEAKKKRNFVFCSVKYFLSDDKKSVDQYDVTNIISAALGGKYAEDEFRILILANDKSAVKSKFANAMRRYITYIVKKDTVDGGVLGRDDLEAAFTRLRDRVRGSASIEEYVQKTFFGEKSALPFLSLRFHQELIVKKTIEIMKEAGRSSVLWGVVARGGKTYITGGLIRDVRPKTVFIVAGAYTETHTQFLDDLLDVSKRGMQDFADYIVVDVKNDSFKYDSSKKYIFFMSLELLKLTGTAAKKRSVMNLVEMKMIVPDVVFFDEIHKGGTTLLADKAVELIAHSAFKVFMTATYIKPFIKPEYKLDAGNLITWGYEDILTAKSMDSPDTVVYFEKKYGTDVCRAVLQHLNDRGISVQDIAAQYQKFPEIQFLTTAFSDEFEESMVRQNVIDAKTGFKMSTLFAIGKDCMKVPFKKRWECFASPATVGLFLNYMGPANSQMSSLPGGSKVKELASPHEHITDRIGRTSQRRSDRLKNLEKEFKPHSQLWFLPQASGDGVSDKPLLSMMTCLASILGQHAWFRKNFCAVCVSSGFGKDDEDFIYDDGGFVGFTNGGMDTKKTVLDYEKRAYASRRGLIIIAGRMLTLGVSLPCVNVVALLDDSTSSDLTYQKMFRALTESEGKTVGYIVDVNPIRTLKTLYDYTSVEHRESDDHVPVTITTLTNMYLIDEDKMFVIGEDGSHLTSKDLHKKLDTYLQASRKIYKTIFAEASANMSAIDLTEEFGLLRDALSRSRPEALGLVSDLAGSEVPSGMERIAEAAPEAAPKPTKKTAQEELERLRSLREMVLTSMTLLAFLTTDVDLKDAFERYKRNEDRLQDIVYDTIVDRGLASEGTDKEKIKNVLVSAMGKSMVKLMEPYRKMRTQLSEFTGDQKEVIEFIETNLKPKKEQVAARGEVFTPLELVSEMLSHLPDDVWTHPEYKWLDPAGGLGQFPVIAYAKLDDGLKPAMPDDIARRKHIVENMLYIVELDNTNVELSRTLLQKMCGAPGCKLNLVKHDFLTVNTTEAFGLPKFKVIMGNPPYNPPKTETGSSGNSIWQNFVMKSESLLEDDGYLCFVHPPGWKKPTEDVYKPEKFAAGNYKGQIRQGQVWQYMKGRGSFTYVYTNDQKSKAIEFFPNFPAVDYYVFQKDGDTVCDTRNMFNGNEYLSTEVRLNSSLPYLPCLITKDSINTVSALFLKEGQKPKFKAGFDPRGFKVREKGEVQYIYEASAKGPMYQYFSESHETVGLSKVVINYGGGVNGYYAKYIDSSEKIGVLHMTMYYPVSSSSDGLALERFYNSDIVKFLFLITQYSSGKMPKNEPLVANSITLPPGDITDYYGFFGIEEYKPFIEKVLADYATFKAPKKKGADRSTTPHKKLGSVVTRRKLSK